MSNDADFLNRAAQALRVLDAQQRLREALGDRSRALVLESVNVERHEVTVTWCDDSGGMTLDYSVAEVLRTRAPEVAIGPRG